MFELAFLIGLYSYIIFFLGLFGILYSNFIVAASIIYITFLVFYFVKFKKINIENFYMFKTNKLSKIILLLIAVQLIINFIGVLGPEISFDALWYHLTIPKLFLLSHKIYHIPGNLLFYSDMPKLTEMLYTAGIAVLNEYAAKFINFSFGILILVAIYKLSRKYIPQSLSLLAALIFYSNLVVGWESISAYIDLSRSFFELMTLWAFLNWVENRNMKWIILSGIMLGFAISSKVISLESFFIYFCLLIYLMLIKKITVYYFAKNLSLFTIFSFLIPIPWFLFSYINTHNFIYPFFDNRIQIGTSFNFPNFENLFKDFINLFVYSNDPISPIYLIILPLVLILFKRASANFKIIYLYCFFALIMWYITPKIGGGRFILSYLPAFSILAVYPISILKSKILTTFLIIIILSVSVISIGYRGIANKKFIPVILGRETKSQFLTKNLNFNFGDFYDTDNYFKEKIKPTDTVLLYGFHNLYYVDFPFIDSSWVKKGDKFDYIAVQNSTLPNKFSNWKVIYYNKTTNVELYSLNKNIWTY